MLLVLLPAGAAAQSAGDEQYQDPFADDPAQEAPAAPPAATPAPAAPAPAAAAPATAAPAAAPQATAAQLPRTGGEAWLLALAGLALMSAGVALRAHARQSA
jgi:LPXTG-motif cell wall-anchored protein